MLGCAGGTRLDGELSEVLARPVRQLRGAHARWAMFTRHNMRKHGASITCDTFVWRLLLQSTMARCVRQSETRPYWECLDGFACNTAKFVAAAVANTTGQCTVSLDDLLATIQDSSQANFLQLLDTFKSSNNQTLSSLLATFQNSSSTNFNQLLTTFNQSSSQNFQSVLNNITASKTNNLDPLLALLNSTNANNLNNLIATFQSTNAQNLVRALPGVTRRVLCASKHHGQHRSQCGGSMGDLCCAPICRAVC